MSPETVFRSSSGPTSCQLQVAADGRGAHRALAVVTARRDSPLTVLSFEIAVAELGLDAAAHRLQALRCRARP